MSARARHERSAVRGLPGALAVLLLALILHPAALRAQTAPADPPAPGGNITIVPRTTEPRPPAAAPGGAAQVTLSASMTEDSQPIDQGLVWRIYRDKPDATGKPRLVSMHRDATPQVRLDPGDYVINVSYGRANLTRKVTLSADKPAQERFVLNAGGLRLVFAYASGEAPTERAASYDIYSDERDQSGQRKLVVSGAKPGVVVRLNAGIYNVVSTYGDANAVARSDVTVEAGKLTEATLTHQAAKVTLKLVTRAGGDALADTQWIITTRQGDVVKESVGALPSHLLAPGAYTATAKNGGLAFQRDFAVKPGQITQVEVLRR